MQQVFGGAPHMLPVVFLSLVYVFFAYGLFLSRRIQGTQLRLVADVFASAAICVAFARYLADFAAFVFLAGMPAVLLVVWLLITQQGPWQLRLALLCAALSAVSLGFLYLGAAELAQLLGCALLASAAKEVLGEGLPAARRAVRVRRVEALESGLGEAPLRPLMNSLASEPFQLGNPESHPAVAARVAASARASLAAAQASGAGGAGGAADPEAAAAWARHRRACDAGAGGSEAAGDAEGGRAVAFGLRGVSYRLSKERRLLQNLSFTVPGGAKVAVMGASGSGKTTLLSVLSGRCGDGRFEGEMTLNGALVLPWQMASLRPLIGYVPQDDVMHTTLSVRENISFCAALRSEMQTSLDVGEWPPPPESESHVRGEACRGHQELSARVDAIIDGLGLARVADRAINDGLSGGQRKRASIGMELVSKPRILLLDEPSTGLDAATSHRILEVVLGCAASEQCTTFSTIHQPRWTTLTLFDMLVLLAPGGHLCFAGPVVAVEAYFQEVLHVEFPEDENPADIIIDVCTFDSARRMAVDGQWRSPPQCLRAVLFPTPEAVGEDCRAHWQQEEFGQLLAALWADFSAARGLGPPGRPGPAAPGAEGAAAARGPGPLGPRREARRLVLQPLELEAAAPAPARAGGRPGGSLGDLAREAGAREGARHWAEQVWLQLLRSLQITSRALPTLALNLCLLALGTASVTWAFPASQLSHVFLPTSLALLLLCLAQSVAALRIFGGAERQVAWREANVCSLRQVLFSFIGKDLASVLEILLSALCFTATFYPDANTFASVFDVHAIGFAYLYCIWGLNYIWSILFPPNCAMLFSVVVAFLSFLFAGLRPPAAEMGASLGGYGRLLLLASPIRWSLSHFIFRHVTGRGSTYLEDTLKAEVGKNFAHKGFALDSLVGHQCPATSLTIRERWQGAQGMVCHSGQLILLGLLFRLLAAVALLLSSSSKASGGELPLGISSRTGSRLLRDAMFALLASFVLLQLLLLGETF